MKCKILGTPLTPFMSFGKMPIANGFLKKKILKRNFFLTLGLVFQKNVLCFNLQITLLQISYLIVTILFLLAVLTL